jgi:predicted RNA-binding protein with RPS1 domain
MEIESLTKISLTDYNIIAEYFYRDLLKFYGFELENLNEKKKNADSIDLVDEKNKIAIQVTSRNDTTKIHETIKGFRSNPEYDEYEQLIMLLIGKPKLKYPQTDFTNGNLFSFNKKKDIIDVDDIIKKFRSYTAEQLKPIVTFLESEINLKIETKRSKATEVVTIIKMIEYLSDDENYKEVDKVETADPERKRQRFKEHFDYLMHQYEERLSIYAGTLEEAKKSAGYDGLRAKKISLYLRDISDDYLTKNDNNPKEAIDALVAYFQNEISEINGIYDYQAIKFYLLDELIQCNVFPNPNEL